MKNLAPFARAGFVSIAGVFAVSMAAHAQEAPVVPNDAGRAEIKAACDAYRQSLIDAGRIIIETPDQLDKLAGRTEGAFWRTGARVKIATQEGVKRARKGEDRPPDYGPAGEIIVISPDADKKDANAAPAEEAAPPGAARLYQRFRTSHPLRIMEGDLHRNTPAFGCHFYEFTVSAKNRSSNRKLLYAAPKKFKQNWSSVWPMKKIKDLYTSYWRTSPYDGVRGDKNAKIIWEFWQEYEPLERFRQKCATINAFYAARETLRQEASPGRRARIVSDTPLMELVQDGEIYNCGFIKFDIDADGRAFNHHLVLDDAVVGSKGYPFETAVLNDRRVSGGSAGSLAVLREEYVRMIDGLEIEPAVDATGAPTVSLDHYVRIDMFRRDWEEEVAGLEEETPQTN